MSDLAELAADAYVYGFPVVANLDAVHLFTRRGVGPMGPAPFNTFRHAHSLPGPKETDVGGGHDTVPSIAHLDLSGGPLLLRVPDTARRYYVLRFVDAWTGTFAYVGRRATGTAAGAFLLTPPDWSGEVPAGATRISAPTTVVSIVGSWACDGARDLPAVRALQRATTLEPLDGARPSAAPPSPESDVDGAELLFFEKLRSRMRAFPPAPAELEYQQRFAPLGLLDERSPYADPSARLAAALRAGHQRGARRVEHAAANGGGPETNGWKPTYGAFNHNLDFFEVGTVRSPSWVLADRDEARTVRAAAARAGLWGNHGYESACAMAWNDGDGHRLDGTRSYTLRFEAPPPVDAFWSLTMYDMPHYQLVDNPAGRYSIGDRTPDLHYDRDDSLTVYLQPERPADRAEAANWLPTPPGPFRPVLRMYQPHPAVFDGRFTIPAITRRGGS